MNIFIGADHRGFNLKEKIKLWLAERHYEATDLGAFDYDSKDDYTLYAEKVAEKVGADQSSRGILLCGSGIGVEIVANKIDGVRAGLGKNPDHVKMGRTNDDMNVLVMAADFTTDQEAKAMLQTFLETQFGGEERHVRRLEDIKKIEQKY